MQGEIKNIIFDLGGVIYAIDYHKTITAFKNLGIKNFDKLFAKAAQQNIFDDLETGTISKSEFFVEINLLIQDYLTDNQITEAWNAMLLQFMPEALSCLDEISSDYRLFLLSNTNEIHIEFIKNQVGEENFKSFCARFEKVYLSHEIGKRKPHAKVFDYIINEKKLKKDETLFIDDSIQHVQGAIKAGLQAYHLDKGESISNFFREK